MELFADRFRKCPPGAEVKDCEKDTRYEKILILRTALICLSIMYRYVRPYGLSQRETLPDAVHIQLNLLKMSILMLETCRAAFLKLFSSGDHFH